MDEKIKVRDIIEIDEMLSKAKMLKQENIRMSFEVAKEAFNYASNVSYEKGQAIALFMMGSISEIEGEFEDSISYLFPSIEISARLNLLEIQADAFNEVGIVFSYLCDYERALNYYFKGMKIAKEINDNRMIGMIYNNIGEVYRELKSYDDALEYYEKSIEIDEKISYSATNGISILNAGSIYNVIGKTDKALECINMGIYFMKKNERKLEYNEVLNELALCYVTADEKEKAKEYFEEAIRISELDDRKFVEIDILLNYYNFLKANGETEKAISLIDRALEYSYITNAYVKVPVIYSMLADLFEELGDKNRSGEFYKKYHEAQKNYEEIFNSQRIESIKIQNIIEQREEEAEIIKKKNEKLIKKSEQLEESYNNILVISKMGRDITSTLNINEIVNLIYKNLDDVIPLAAFGIASFDDKNEIINYELFLEDGLPIKIPSLSLNLPNSLTAFCVRSKETIIINDIATDYVNYVDAFNNIMLVGKVDDYKSLIYCPLMIKDSVVGVLSVQCYEKNAFSKYHIEMIKAISSYSAIALNNAQKSKALEELNAKLKYLSDNDSLTAIANRRNFDEALEFSWRVALEANRSIALILIDIDKFKEYNDYYGHVSGDLCIKTVAKTIKSKIRNNKDFVARYGGDEFIVILQDTNLDQAIEFSKILNKSVLDLKIPHDYSGINDFVSITLGVEAVIPDRSMDTIDLIKRADKALYAAKRQGRNRVIGYK